jgi:hypothetical protein
MKKFLKIVAILIALSLATDVLVSTAMARGGGGRGGGRGGGGGGRGGAGGRGGGRGGRGGKGSSETAKSPREAFQALLEQRIADEREACMEAGREAGADAGVDSTNDRIRKKDREDVSKARRADWRPRANPG